jgi:hypothetical protein
MGALALAALVVVTGCGRGAGERETGVASLAAAGTKTAAAGTARLHATVTLSAGPDRQSVEGEGVVDLRHNASDLVYEVDGRHVTERHIGNVMYVKPAVANRARLLHGKSWGRIDYAAVAETATGLSMSELGGNNADGRDVLTSMEALGDVEKVGTESIDGVTVTHYRASLDPSKRNISPRARAALGKVLTKVGTRLLPLDVWLYDSGLIRRLRTRQLIDLPASAPADRVMSTTTLDYSDYGTKVDIKPPPAGQTYDLTSTVAAEVKAKD